MIEAVTTRQFADWLKSLKDGPTQARIARRIDRLRHGNPGDVRPIGDGLSELRIDFGPGYRIYFKQVGRKIVLLLFGGDKQTQERDIIKAKALVREWMEQGS